MVATAGDKHAVMIMVAPNGARRTKADHPAVPITPAEIAEDAVRVLKVGASAIHLHVRDDDGGHVLDAARYRKTTEAIRAAVGDDVVVQITTEAVGRYGPTEQMDVVRETLPEAVSLALSEICPDEATEDDARSFFAWLRDSRISPQFILYSPDEVTRLLRLRESGVVPFAAPFLQFVLGKYSADQESDPADLDPFIAALGGETMPWSVCAFGRRGIECGAKAIACGGHVRIGLENNLHLADGTPASGNADLVAAVADAARERGHPIMDGHEARRFMLEAAR